MNLVFHQAALGDFALILPLLRGLEGSTTVVTPWSRGRLASALIPGVSAMDIELFEFTRLHRDPGPRTLSPAVAELFDAARVVITFIGDGEDTWAENMVRLAPQANLVWLPTRPGGLWDAGTTHAADFHRETLMSHGVAVAEAEVAESGRADGPIVVHPGSGGESKCWPRERFAALVEALRDRKLPVRVVYGEAEAERWPAEELERWHAEFDARGCATLEQLVELLADARRFVGNDAGPTQLAAQLGVPTTALFGPTEPTAWAPRGPAVDVIAPDEPCPMDWLEVDRLLSRLGVDA
ncbi:MAG: glycosyltransferase family 9 protein [Planctomycetota bacterium]